MTADLQHRYGVRLLDVFTGARHPAEVLAYIEALPQDSAFAEAQAEDDELAEALAGQEQEAARSPRIRDFGSTNQLLTVISDRLGELIAATVAAGGAKPPRVDPLPRPVTALDRAAQRLSEASYDYLMEQIESARTAG